MIGGDLASLAARGRTVTRQVSAENPTGARNAGALATPDPDDPDLPHSRAAIDLGPGFKVRPFVSVAPRGSVVLADIAGAGVVTHWYLTSNARDFGALRLTIEVDGQPAVDVTLASMLCLGGPGWANRVMSVPLVVGPTRGCSVFWQMPYRDGIRLTVHNDGDEHVDVIAYKVTFEQREVDEVPPTTFHARTVTGNPDPDTSEFELAGIEGAGLYVGTALHWRAVRPRWWGEGEIKFTFGGDEHPSLVDTGTEDYFGGAWGFGRDSTYLPAGPEGEQTFTGPYAGVPYQDTNEGYPREIVLYRWHIADPIGFDDGLRVAVQAIGQGPDDKYEVRADDVLTATAMWYSSP